MFQKRFSFTVFFIFISFYTRYVAAQSPEPYTYAVPSPATYQIKTNEYGFGSTLENTPPFSPSITAFSSGNAENLVCAYVYRKEQAVRTVGFSRSTNGGTSWAVISSNGSPIALPVPSDVTCLDEPQLLAIGGDTLICVVRAFNASGYGNRAQEQPNSIKTNAKILLYVSMDKGSSWGYYTGAGGAYSTSGYKVVAQSAGGTGVYETVESPRIAFRKGFSDFGVVTWNRKRWTHDLATTIFEVSVTEVGCRAFNTTVHSQPGLVVTDDGYFSFNAPNQGPERATVALSPDGGIWLAYYCPDYVNSDRKRNIKAEWEIVRGDFTTGSGGQLTVSFGTSARFKSNENVNGAYDPQRGYLYGADSLFHDFTNASDSDVVDLAAGPSVQVAVEDPLSCATKYTLGILCSFGNNLDFRTNPSTYNDSTSLFFYSAHLANGQGAGDWLANRVNYSIVNDTMALPVDTVAGGHEFNVMRILPVLKYVNVTDAYHSKLVFDPAMTANGINLREAGYPRSYFCLSYMRLARKLDYYDVVGGAKVFWRWFSQRCMTALSYDNETFAVSKYNGIDETRLPLVKPAGIELAHDNAIFPTYWGKQIDVCGEYGTFRVHPAWHNIQRNQYTFTTQGIRTANFEGIIVKPYLQDYPSNDPEAFPIYSKRSPGSLNRFFKMSNETIQDGWSPYVYFESEVLDPNYINVVIWRDRPSGISSKAKYETKTVLGLPDEDEFNFVGKYNGTFGLLPLVGTAPIGAGQYYANYDKPTRTYGGLGFSDQRQSVMTGRMIHAVAINPVTNVVEYQMSRGLSGSTASADWILPVPLTAASSVTYARPSIGVYQESPRQLVVGGNVVGENSTFCGQAAVAATWVETDNDPSRTGYRRVKIKLRIREFDICNAEWAPWSETYTVHTHYFQNAANLGLGDDDFTTPVIAPIVKPLGNGTGLVSTDLIGWTVTWASPKLALNGSVWDAEQSSAGYGTCLRKYKSAVYSRSLLRRASTGLLTSNSKWGQFESATTVEASGYVGLQPPSSATSPFNLIVATSGCDNFDPIRYVSVASAENKTTFQYDQQIAFSTDGSKRGIWTTDITYNLINGSTNLVQSPITALGVLPAGTACTYSASDRNPCVTVNSSGQRFISWERMIRTYVDPYPYNPPQGSTHYTSQIMTANSFFGAASPNLWVKNGVPAATLSVTSAYANNTAFEWLRNPSITSFPKSRLVDHPDINLDLDRGVVEMGLWQQNKLINNVKTSVDNLFTRVYYENGAIKGTGNWFIPLFSVGSGTYSQRSFGQYNAGPAAIAGTSSLSVSGYKGNSFFLANNPLLASIYSGSYKGTFDSILNVTQYRGEMRYADCAFALFKWGGAFLVNPSTGARRQIQFHRGDKNPNGWYSVNEMRDSLYSTEEFDWNTNEVLEIYRGIEVSDSASLALGGSLAGSNIDLKFRLELVSSNGVITQLDDARLNPASSSYGQGRLLQITNDSTYARNVRIRVRMLSDSGFLRGDSSVELYDIAALAQEVPLDSLALSLKKNSGNLSKNASFAALSPYPNPIGGSEQSLRLEFRGELGGIYEISLIDLLGRDITNVKGEISGAQQSVALPRPQRPGHYTVKITDGVHSQHFSVVVLE